MDERIEKIEITKQGGKIELSVKADGGTAVFMLGATIGTVSEELEKKIGMPKEKIADAAREFAFADDGDQAAFFAINDAMVAAHDAGDKESLEKMVRTMKEAWEDECDEVN